MSAYRPKLSGAFLNNRPKLSQIDKFTSSVKKIIQTEVEVNINKYKVGDFLCISLILTFICYFIFFGKKDNRKQQDSELTKNKLEQIKTLNYNFFKNNKNT
jgi:hypothetical protein